MWIAILSFLIFLVLGMPIAFVLGLTGVVFIWISEITFALVPQRMFVFMDSFVLIAIPCYILVGALMTHGGLTERLVKFLLVLFGHIRGALAIVNVLASMVFAGIQGSALADTAAIGGILIPMMKKAGYTPENSAAITAASSTIGPIIPPSILFVVYGAMTKTSIGALFLGGAIPGILAGVSLIVFIAIIGKIQNWEKMPVRASLKEVLSGAKDAILALIAPLIIIGGIISGFVTPTESAIIAVIYSFICGTFIFKKIKLRDLPKILLECGILSGGIMLLVGMAGISSWVIIYLQIPRLISEAILGISQNPILILLMMNLILLFAGTFLEQIAAITIFMPIFLPIALHIGMDPVHFGVVLVFNLVIGLVTPPVGDCLYLAAMIAKIKFERVAVAIFPYICILIFVLLLITFYPPLVTTLPRIFLQ